MYKTRRLMKRRPRFSQVLPLSLFCDPAPFCYFMLPLLLWPLISVLSSHNATCIVAWSGCRVVVVCCGACSARLLKVVLFEEEVTLYLGRDCGGGGW
jgi:hypothetical protein